ncbi:hypothetical protein H8K55_02725 [Undibacterium sp. LX15W]|uniref:IgA peptidase M64 n=2 Tax=Undibacterium flavidum TaxID=2762297 RepID=A0ABR6Y7B7_9BURK|nr:hypothetical protein [Undibacterium flavidum]
MGIVSLLSVTGLAASANLAYAQNVNLQIELKPGRIAKTELAITPLQAEFGNFALTKSLPAHANGSQLRVVARNLQGEIVHEVVVPNRLHRLLETFDPKTGAIKHAETVTQARTTMDVSMPFGVDIASIQVLPQLTAAQAAQQGFASPVIRLDRTQIQSLISSTKLQKATAAAPTALAAAPTLTTILNNGSTASKLDFVFIGDGYTAAEMSKWQSDAQSIIEAFKADPLLAANLSKINIHRVDIASNQSGADEIDKGIYRDTAMDGEFGCYNIARLLCVNVTKVKNIVSQVLPADGREQIVVISNSTRYGGSGGEVAAVSMDPSSKEVALHEIGHSAFGLADEYDYGTCDTSVEPTPGNVSRLGTRSNTKWGDLISASTPVPTQVGMYANGTVGTFQGGNYCTSGIYRPTENSRMRTLGNPWHAVNTRLANAVFAKYNGSGTSTEVTQTGSIALGATVSVPNVSPNYVQAGNGTYVVKLTGPAGTDFDLFLYKWNGTTSKWDQVAKADGNTSTETISYNGTAGYYYASVKAYSGSGTYTVKYTFPPK